MNKLILKPVLIYSMISIVYNLSLGQELSKKERKEKQKQETQQYVDSLINSGNFEFIPKTAYPMGARSVNLTNFSNYLKIFTDSLSGDLPYFGKMYNAPVYGGESGIRFNGKPKKFTLTKTNKNYRIAATIASAKESFQFFLTISFTGSASLSIMGSNRENINYDGVISNLKTGNK